MKSLAMHETRMITRRGVWPAALVLHAVSTSLFVVLWAPTGGVPLWQASVLQQLAAADRVVIAIVLTWLSTFVLADDEGRGRSSLDWSALTGRPPQTIVRARIAAMALMSLMLVAVALPAFVAAAEVSAAPISELAWQVGAALGFACFCLGATSLVSATTRDRVAVWCIAMAVCGLTAVGVRMFDTIILRAVVPGAAGLVLLALAPSVVKTRRLANVG